ncbi:MAG: ornithine carbamoyltransferase [Deltaproteobacteria bacterium]|nr:ornithine carbamoyltransferase [Deltaproteobacteria bacterium]MBW2444990.1 ornithine carbamoyltransferase [Deltaproteobacteria bacterium]
MAGSKDFLTVADWPAEELRALLERARELKDLDKRGERPQTLLGRTMALYFEKPSLRTHVTFEAGMTQLGGHAILLRPEQVGIGSRETPADVARGLSRWVDALTCRTFSHELLEEIAQHSTIPVINALTDRFHPCQIIADLQTVAERADLDRAVLAYVGDGNNVAASLTLAVSILGMELRVATPDTHRVAPEVCAQAATLAEASGAKILYTADPVEAVRGADFVYTDTWTSMGQEDEKAERKKIFAAYQVNTRLLEHAPEAWVLHCLPAYRELEISSSVLDGERSIVWDQAENRLHSQKAILERLILGPF